MPPDGYTTITIPDALTDRLDEWADGSSRAVAIEALLESAESGDADVLTVDEFETRTRKIAEDVVSRTARKTADELEQRLR